jgi:1-phosphofructokinase family hexose kinase
VGEVLDELLAAEGIPRDFLRIASTTREGVTYREPDGTWSAVFEPPHEVTPAEAEAIAGKCLALLPDNGWVVCCGSSPCPATDEMYARIIAEARRSGSRAALDSYGTSFRLALDAVPYLVKVNADEYGQTFGRKPGADQEFRAALQTLAAKGIRIAIITDGPRPCYATDGRNWWKAVPPAVKSVNPTGSGDSMIAGILASLEQGEDLPGAIVRGCAAGAANAEMWEVSEAAPERIGTLMKQVRIEEMGDLGG